MPYLLVIAAIIVLSLAPAAGQDEAASPPSAEAPGAVPLRVGVAERPPFAARTQDGTWQGLGINLWRSAAEELDLDYVFVPVAQDQGIAALTGGQLDVMLPVFATSEAARRADLVFPFYTAHLGVAEPRSNRLLDVVANLFSWQFLRIVLYLSALLLVVGAIIWLLERRRNDDQFHPSWFRGLGDGFWWAGVTLTTIGYGDKAPTTLPGRAVAMLWMLIGLAVSAALTAAVVSATDRGTRSADALAAYVGERSVGAVRGTGAFDFLDTARKSPEAFADLGEGLRAVTDGRIDMLVHAEPSLRYAADQQGLNLSVSTSKAQPVLVTMAVRDDAELAEALERFVVARTTTTSWWSHVDRWVAEPKG